MPARTLQQQQQQQQPFPLSPPTTATATAAAGFTPPPSSAAGISPGILITVLILAAAVLLSASLYLLLRFLRRPSHSHSHSLSSQHQHHLQTRHDPRRVDNKHRHEQKPTDPLIDSLPLFSFDSLSLSSASGDCAVCLSKFDSGDLLRLLPLCCHAFHQPCIDTWLSNNLTCPLCRSPVLPPSLSLSSSRSLSSSGSFRVEIGNVSRRGPPDADNHPASSGEIRRSYSISDSFDYVLDGAAAAELPAASFRRTASSDFKAAGLEEDGRGLALAAEVGARGGGGGSWLKDYLSLSYSSRSSSRTASFRGSGRWFFPGGSGRRSSNTAPFGPHPPAADVDIEANHFGDEIGELFRWLSGV